MTREEAISFLERNYEKIRNEMLLSGFAAIRILLEREAKKMRKVEFLLAFDDKTWDTEVFEVPEKQAGTMDDLRVWAEENLVKLPRLSNVVQIAVYNMDLSEDEGHCPDEGCPGILEGGYCSHCGDAWESIDPRDLKLG